MDQGKSLHQDLVRILHGKLRREISDPETSPTVTAPWPQEQSKICPRPYSCRIIMSSIEDLFGIEGLITETPKAQLHTMRSLK